MAGKVVETVPGLFLKLVYGRLCSGYELESALVDVYHGVEGGLLHAYTVIVEKESEVVDYLEDCGVLFFACFLDEADYEVFDLR